MADKEKQSKGSVVKKGSKKPKGALLRGTDPKVSTSQTIRSSSKFQDSSMVTTDSAVESVALGGMLGTQQHANYSPPIDHGISSVDSSNIDKTSVLIGGVINPVPRSNRVTTVVSVHNAVGGLYTTSSNDTARSVQSVGVPIFSGSNVEPMSAAAAPCERPVITQPSRGVNPFIPQGFSNNGQVVYALDGQRSSPSVAGPSSMNDMNNMNTQGLNNWPMMPSFNWQPSGFCPPFNPFMMTQSGMPAAMQWQQGVNMQAANQYGQQPVHSMPVIDQPGGTGTTSGSKPRSSVKRPVVPAKTRRGGTGVAKRAAHVHDIIDSDSDIDEINEESDSNDGNDDDDDFAYSDDDGQEASSSAQKEAIRKLSELFAASRIDPILGALRDEFGLEPVEGSEGEEGLCSLRFGGIGVDNDTHPPVICMPPDILKEQKKVAKTEWKRWPSRVIAQAFKVPRVDHDTLFTVPKMDKEATAVLPKNQRKMASWFKPFFYSPYWEQNLFHLDAHLKLMTRLSAFQLTITNYLLARLEDDGEDTGVMAVSTLVNDITAQQLKSSMQLSKHMTTLRRENVMAFLRREYVDEVSSDLRKLPYTEGYVFGGSFGKTIRSLAKKKRDQKSLESDLKPLSSSSGNKRKTGGIRRPQVQQATGGAGYPNRGGSSRGGRGGRGGKRNNTSQRPPAAAGGPPNAKKARGGSQRRF